MLHMCSDGHEPIIFDGEKEDCPLCQAELRIEAQKEKTNKWIEEAQKKQEKIDELVNTEYIYNATKGLSF